LVAEGNIYTSALANTPNFGTTSSAPQLTVNGSIISLGQGSQRIYFNRSLVDNSQAAEVVNYQPKYLVLLRGLLTQSYTIQREIGPDEIPTSSIFPSPTGYPSPNVSGNNCDINPVSITSFVSFVTSCAIP
jgi:hypothetical protein